MWTTSYRVSNDPTFYAYWSWYDRCGQLRIVSPTILLCTPAGPGMTDAVDRTLKPQLFVNLSQSQRELLQQYINALP